MAVADYGSGPEYEPESAWEARHRGTDEGAHHKPLPGYEVWWDDDLRTLDGHAALRLLELDQIEFRHHYGEEA